MSTPGNKGGLVVVGDRGIVQGHEGMAAMMASVGPMSASKKSELRDRQKARTDRAEGVLKQLMASSGQASKETMESVTDKNNAFAKEVVEKNNAAAVQANMATQKSLSAAYGDFTRVLNEEAFYDLQLAKAPSFDSDAYVHLLSCLLSPHWLLLTKTSTIASCSLL